MIRLPVNTNFDGSGWFLCPALLQKQRDSLQGSAGFKDIFREDLPPWCQLYGNLGNTLSVPGEDE